MIFDDFPDLFRYQFQHLFFPANGRHNGSKKQPKLDQKSIKIDPEIEPEFRTPKNSKQTLRYYQFSTFWRRLADFGAIFDPIGFSRGSPNRPFLKKIQKINKKKEVQETA
jgi:hypothetical protein